QRFKLLLALSAKSDLFGIGILDVIQRPQMNETIVAVNNNWLIVLSQCDNACGLTNNGDTHCSGNNNHMAGNCAFFKHHTAKLLARIIKKLSSAHRTRQNNRVTRKIFEITTTSANQLTK